MKKKKKKVGTNGVLTVKVDWADTPATKRVAETIDRRADFIAIVTRARKDKPREKCVVKLGGKE